VLSAYSWQQPVSHSAFVVQSRRHPAKSGFVDSTHEPWQQSFGVVDVPGVHVSPCLRHGFAQASASAQISVPVSHRSVQQPLSQSAPDVQARSQALKPPRSMHEKPSQHGLVAVQARPSPLQRPASAEGLEQLPYMAPASPVQKHEACSNVMHV
jgi:hypothetical protein